MKVLIDKENVKKMPENNQKTVLFYSVNAAGHVNSCLGLADLMKRELNCKTVFLLLGSTIGTSIEDHGHQLVTVTDASMFEDYEIESDEDPSKPVDEELKKSQGKVKVKFEGALKWPQLVRRMDYLLGDSDPVKAFVNRMEISERLMLEEFELNHDSYDREIERIAPDLIVVDNNFIPPFVVNAQVPWVRLWSACPLSLTQAKLPDGLKPPQYCGFQLYDKETRLKLKEEQPEKWQAMLDEWKRAKEKIAAGSKKLGAGFRDYLIKHNCPPLSAGKLTHDSPYLNVYMYPKALDFDQDDDLLEYPARWVRCDSLMRQQSLAGSREARQLNEWQAKLKQASVGKEAVVFFSLGSIASGNHDLMRHYVDYMKCDQKRLYVVSKGTNGDKYQLDENNMIGGNYIPQAFFLQNCNMAIVHGGNNSVTECMYYGKPIIVLPMYSDQWDNAQRVEDLKLGYRLDAHNCNQKQLLETVDKVLNDKQMIDKASHIGKQMRSRDDLKNVVGLLDELLQNGSLDDKSIEEYRRKSNS